MKLSNTLKNWDASDRPREKLAEKGASALTDSELLAILLRTGSSGQSAVDLARSLLQSAGRALAQLPGLTLAEMEALPGMGRVKAVTLLASFELGRRTREGAGSTGQPIQKSSDAFNVLAVALQGLPHEEMHVLYLNRMNKVIRRAKVSQGGLTSTVVDVRIILREALACSACGLIVAHNHPSGSLQPSAEDKAVTRKIAAAAQILNLQLLDHIILGEQNYFSFADEGILPA
ncbi:MAG: DNA repair protein RadC [Bacteroidales bacterium]